MNWIAIIFFSVATLFQGSTTGIRASFEVANTSVENAEVFYNASLKLSNSDLSNAYIGAALITKGKFEKGLKNKKQVIEKGASLLDKSVANKPKDVEIRLIRLIIQEHLPKIVKYKANMQEDKEVIVKNYATQSTDLKKWIANYAQKSAVFTAEDRKNLL